MSSDLVDLLERVYLCGAQDENMQVEGGGAHLEGTRLGVREYPVKWRG